MIIIAPICEAQVWARSSAWLERSTDNRGVQF